MPTIPTTQELASDLVSHLESALAQTIPILPKAWTRVLAKALGGKLVILYKYWGFSFLQLFVEHASFEETTINGKTVTPLVFWGRLFGVGDPVASTRAEHTLQVTINTQTGNIPANTLLLHPATGIIHKTKAAVALNAATVSVTIVASSDQDGGDGSGTEANLEAGDVLEFANKPLNIEREATVTARTVDGADGDTEVTYRKKVISFVQAPPQGGAYADYRHWGEEVVGITNVYPYTGDPGEVDVYCEATEASSGSEDGIPTAPQLAAVLSSLRFNLAGEATRRPVNAALNVLAITREEFNVTVLGLQGEDTDSIEASINEGLDEFLRSREPFIEGLSVLPRLDRVTQGEISGLVNEIANAAGGSVTSVTLYRGAESIVAWTLGDGVKAKLGNSGEATFIY
jgi:uncharacterized phage protein gp47/JayE